MKPNVSILWDIENVTPSMNAYFTVGLLEYARKEGSISSATAIGNWKKQLSNDLALNLSENGFELIHIPQPEKKGRAKKNSADFALITKATEMVFQYPHIETYIILTGDIDFRALLQTLKKHGKRIIIICDAKNAAENLLELADEYLDYRDLLPDDGAEESNDTEEPRPIKKEAAFMMLAETVRILHGEEKVANPGGVKVRMKLLNENFSGDVEGFSSWNKFINDAVKHEIVKRQDSEKGIVLAVPGKQKATEEIPKVMQKLLKAVKAAPGDDVWVSFSAVGNKLVSNKVQIKDYNYSQLKKLILDAEKRGLVKTRNQNGKWSVSVA
ncbi:MAG: NYN domain-containing protein [Candidatus Hydrogenedentota bacterium]